MTAATGVGTGVVLSGYGILAAEAAALLMLIAVLIIALLVQARRPDAWAYPLAIIWALAGVISANIAMENWTIIGLAALGIFNLIMGYALRRSS